MPRAVPRTTEYGDGITAIDTDLLRPLFDASHLIVEGGRAAFVDTGVNSSVPLFLATLQQKDIDVADVDYVFLTHVHLDHAGGAGLLMQSLPNARAVLHPRGAPHMIDPAKLIKGAQAVYGEEEYFRQYGDIVPFPPSGSSLLTTNKSSLSAAGFCRAFTRKATPATTIVFMIMGPAPFLLATASDFPIVNSTRTRGSLFIQRRRLSISIRLRHTRRSIESWDSIPGNCS